MTGPNLENMKKAEAFFYGTKVLCDFVDKRVVPSIVAFENKDDYQEALAVTYYRMQFWMLSAEKLNHPHDFQTIWSAARAVYELLIDLKLLQMFPFKAQAFHDFVFVIRFRAAKHYVDEIAKRPTYVPPGHTNKREVYVSDPQNKQRYDEGLQLVVSQFDHVWLLSCILPAA